jgi:pimeloyl-ACP methyl ester carboxylesterase
MLMVVDAEDRFDATPELHRISAPTLVIAGDRDRYYTPELFRGTTERIPGARLRLYRKGHASIATLRYKPAVREILGFLTDQPRPPRITELNGAGNSEEPVGKA